jgi:hypothetical protein
MVHLLILVGIGLGVMAATLIMFVVAVFLLVSLLVHIFEGR